MPVRWWMHELPKQLLAIPPALLSLLVPGEPLVRYLLAWDIYAVCYLLLTWLAARGRDPSDLRAMALALRSRRTDHLLASTPERLSQLAAAIALVATVNVMPRAQELGAPPALVLTISVVAVATAWLTVHTGFVMVYLGLYAESGGLEFPGDDEPDMVDFLYFGFSIGTTFGTTDVTVTRRRVRRQVLVHGILSFLFNTMILAVAITILTSYITGP
ncbi:DUF1345 domain-containing protein [Nonomuraea sp. NPDC050790]|uniref:DUF1345 domain-containing protein n=1 Tax=Nonomuraea sp. NPDC050790 TaxID=3364371 RepID=UPI0037B47FDD